MPWLLRALNRTFKFVIASTGLLILVVLIGAGNATAFEEQISDITGSVPGVLQAVPLAITADSEEQARFLTDVLGALAKYNQTQTSLARIIVTGTIIGRDRAGALIVPAELDYVVWTKRMAYFANRPDLAAPKRAIWLSGKMSPLAQRNFESRGWTIEQNSRLINNP
jgi:hypothetical protein